MLLRKTLDLVILSILNDFPEKGLTGYALVKEIKDKFGPMMAPSPGTIYPRSKKLKETGDIIEEGKFIKISEQGKKKLEDIPKLMDNSLEFVPKLWKVLMRPLSFNHRMNYACNHRMNYAVDDNSMIEEIHLLSSSSRSIENLHLLKEQLMNMKSKIEKQTLARINSIDGKVQLIDNKIEEMETEKKTWKKIPISED